MTLEPRQKLYAAMGEGACCLLAVVHLLEKVNDQYFDAFWLWREGVERGLVTEACYVNDLASFASMIDGRSWNCRKEGVDYVVKEGEYEIVRYEWQKDAANLKVHFVNGDGKGGIENDPFGQSLTVQNGKAQSKRIFWRS